MIKMNQLPASVLKAISISAAAVIIIAVIGYFVFPNYLFVVPGSKIYTSGVVDHKKIGSGSIDGQPETTYTASIRLFQDDPFNGGKSGETWAYIISENQWNMLEWGDTVKIRLMPELNAEIVELFPALKPPEWSWISESRLKVELKTNKTTFKPGETAIFNVALRNEPNDEDSQYPDKITLRISLSEPSPFWILENGMAKNEQTGDSEIRQIMLDPDQEYSFTFEWKVPQNIQVDSTSVYYVRAYIGHFTENPEITLTGTTIIEIRH